MTEQEIEKLREKLGSDYSVKREGNLVAVELVRVRVEFTWSEGVKEDYRFHFKVSTNDNLHHAGHHLAKCLEDFLNKSQ